MVDVDLFTFLVSYFEISADQKEEDDPQKENKQLQREEAQRVARMREIIPLSMFLFSSSLSAMFIISCWFCC